MSVQAACSLFLKKIVAFRLATVLQERRAFLFEQSPPGVAYPVAQFVAVQDAEICIEQQLEKPVCEVAQQRGPIADTE